MKVILIGIFVFLASIAGFQKDDTYDHENENLFCLEASSYLIRNHKDELRRSLNFALENKTISEAVDLFSFDAQVVSGIYESNELFSVRRISKNPRNQTNSATGYDYDIISEFASSFNPSVPNKIVWNDWRQTSYFYYFEAIRVETHCLLCHGTENEIPYEAGKMIRKLYPKDKATDYREGDLIGFYVVKIKWPQAREVLIEIMKNEKINLADFSIYR